MARSAAETRRRILEAGERLFLRHGAQKVAVVDIARDLGMSHGNIYRHFKDKEEIASALAERWNEAVGQWMAELASRHGHPALPRIEALFQRLLDQYRSDTPEDREVNRFFQTLADRHHAAAVRRQEMVLHSVEALLAQAENQGELALRSRSRAARVILDGMGRFIDPGLVARHRTEPLPQHAKVVLQTLLAGLDQS